MPSGLIFITGATGFIGSATALEALKHGYRLRISVRKESQIPKLRTLLSDFESAIEFVLVPDITKESAFIGTLDGVNYVLHLASPIPSGTDKESYFAPAVKGTTSILREAAKTPTVKRVVITSSIAALIPIKGIPDGGVIKENNGWDLTVEDNDSFTGENDEATAINLYHASKLLANNASWDFQRQVNPTFDLVTIHPAFVFGHNPMQATPEEIKGTTNGLLFGSIMAGIPMGTITAVHISDVAEAHIKALDEKVPGGSKYLLAGEKSQWKEVAAIVKEKYPTCGAKITEEITGTSWPVDTAKAERELGIQWRSLGEIVKEVMDQQLGLRQKAKV
ncbi:hypothetical protein ARAM_002014 [Aspergillus rambellii]|uniref:NAD-dependent epimerase/dehydratase domain-containing protein n=1 Tax=Aspergillus rambellii TaxID=308745 RepID=A0A0F8U625_9EURO|nr:hypothetical protein ARAM_002014 [Aspergillus rambellii]